MNYYMSVYRPCDPNMSEPPQQQTLHTRQPPHVCRYRGPHYETPKAELTHGDLKRKSFRHTHSRFGYPRHAGCYLLPPKLLEKQQTVCIRYARQTYVKSCPMRFSLISHKSVLNLCLCYPIRILAPIPLRHQHSTRSPPLKQSERILHLVVT